MGSIPEQTIPPDTEATATEYAYDSILKYRDSDPIKECAPRGEIDPPHNCRNWEKIYNGGKLESYTTYGVRSYGNSDSQHEYITYSISFHPNGKIAVIGNSDAVQYFDENGNLYQVCDGFEEGVS